MTYIEILDDIQKICKRSDDPSVLSKANERLSQLFAAGNLNEQNKLRATELTYQIQIKLCDIALRSALSGGVAAAKDIALAADRADKLSQKILAANPPDISRAATESFAKIASEAAQLNEAIAAILRLSAISTPAACDDATEELCGYAPPDDLPQVYAKYFEGLIESAKSAVRQRKDGLNMQKYGALYAAFCASPARFENCSYYCGALDTDSELSRIMVICSPLSDEIDFLFAKFSDTRKLSAAWANADALSGASGEAIEFCFEKLKSGADCFYIRGLSALTGDQSALLSACAELGKSSKYTVFADLTPTHTVYDNLLPLCGGQICYNYLSMPDYESVIEICEAAKMPSTPDDYRLLKHCGAVIGFLGLNRILSAADWRTTVESQHNRNKDAVRKFVQALPQTALLIDAKWEYDVLREPLKPQKRREFDYDTVTDFCRDNIRRIISADMSLKAKCGAVTQYCITQGDDISDWDTLGAGEREQRVRRATHCLAQLLETIIPDVNFADEAEWAGMCCGGGTEIKYNRETMTKHIDYFMGTILHEMYHSFQHKAIREGWQPWFLSDLGVTPARVDYWNKNFSVYIPLKDGTPYRMQLVETDSNIFADECKEEANLNLVHLTLDR